jgi:hypothetical protein
MLTWHIRSCILFYMRKFSQYLVLNVILLTRVTSVKSYVLISYKQLTLDISNKVTLLKVRYTE